MIILESALKGMDRFVAIETMGDLNEMYSQLTESDKAATAFLSEFEGLWVKSYNPCKARYEYRAEKHVRERSNG